MILTQNINLIWASLLVEECIRNGADTFFLAPGARCTPLTLAVAHHSEARVVQHFDERGLAFAALGYARATGRPGVLICTSGTAVINLGPALVEASMDAQPLLLLTADRPPELRECGANQSIPQAEAFAAYTTWHQDLPCPDIAITPAYVLSTLAQALLRARSGPVHLNCPFREPLGPMPDRTDAERYLIPLSTWRRSHDPYSVVIPGTRRMDELSASGLDDLLPAHTRVLVIAGGGLSEADALAVNQLAGQRGWPIVSDISSGLHFGPQRKGIVRHVDALVNRDGFPDELRPERILQVGSRFLSKRLLQALEATALQAWVQVTSREVRFDPLHRVSHRFVVDIDRFCLEFGHPTEAPVLPVWSMAWLRADLRVERLYREHLDEAHTLTEPGVARAITRLLPNLHGLVLGASMPIRDVNQFAARNPNRVHVACNRGASGIDGTLATATGFARGHNRPVTVLLGDLTALHDLNSLALLARERVQVIVVIINNHGGGIFHFLPMADTSPEFETYFATPHEWRFKDIARQFGLPYAHPKDLSEFVDAYTEALAETQSCIIEVETHRDQNVEQHLALAEMLKLPVG
jgi:2-succinyl-5-enolpyruvyl-6-hydroxy-3-cyclohexene-1-carboxylate synthase